MSKNLLDSEKGLLKVEIERAKIQEQLRIASDPAEAKQLQLLTKSEEINLAVKNHALKQLEKLNSSYEMLRERLNLTTDSLKNQRREFALSVQEIGAFPKAISAALGVESGGGINRLFQKDLKP